MKKNERALHSSSSSCWLRAPVILFTSTNTQTSTTRISSAS